MSAIEWLLASEEPSVVFQVKRDLLGDEDPPEGARVLEGSRVRALLSGQQDAVELIEKRRLSDGRWRAGGRWWKPPGSKGGSVEVVDWGRSG